MALVQWLPTSTYNADRTLGPFTVPANAMSAHVELTSNNWTASADTLELYLEWSADGTTWQDWQAFGCNEGDRTSKGNMPQVSVSRFPEMGSGAIQARLRVIVVGSLRFGIAGEFVS